MNQTLPAVALIPGFLGFDHKAGYTYFADRLVAGLRAALEARLGASIPVVPTSTLPIASLADRQRELLSDLHTIENGKNGSDGIGARAWHLVGHSTGGVDAAMLLRDAPLTKTKDGSAFGTGGFDPKFAALVQRVESATSIAAPHHGTSLAECPVARAVQGRASTGATLEALADAAMKLKDVVLRDDLASRFGFATGSAPPLADGPKFLWHLFFQNELARDLRPAVAAKLAQRPVRTDRADRLFSVVTIAPPPPANHPDKLFLDLWSWTADAFDVGDQPTPPASAPPLTSAALKLRAQSEQALPALDLRQNDGVVSSLRQVAGETIAVVLADHADVIGRYRRASPVDDNVIDPGLLTSGAAFGDDAFFDMIARVADRIARVIRG